MKFEREYVVGVRDIGLNNQMTNLAFLGFLEEIASTHSSTVGYGVNDIEKNKKVWLLMDWNLQVIERPKYGDILTIKTWARPMEKNLFYTYRDFEVFVGKTKVANATSKWVLFDIEKNRISKIEDNIINLYKTENERVLGEELNKIKEPEQKDFCIKYEVKRADIDINKHMHNLNYLRLAYEVLPEEVYFNKEKQNTRIMYKHQIVLGDKINCYYTKKEDKSIITIKSEDEKILHSIIELN